MDLVTELSGEYRFHKSKLLLGRESTGGRDTVVLSGSTKFSPHVSIAFYYGRHFPEAAAVERLLGWPNAYYHIHQYSLNRHLLADVPYDGPYKWAVDIEVAEPGLAQEIARAIRGIADPFFARFSTLRVARDAIASGDHWCLGFWTQLLTLDLALNDLDHFENWSQQLDEFNRTQAAGLIEKYLRGMGNAA